MLPRFLLAAFLLSGCRAQASPKPVAVTQTTIPATSGAVPTMSITQALSETDLVSRALDSLQALDAADVKFKSERATRIDQMTTMNEQTEVIESLETITGSGFRLHSPDGLNIEVRRTVEFPGSQGKPGLRGEIRLVGGEAYAAADYSDPQPLYPALPDGWIKLSGPSSAMYWPGLYSFSLADIEPGLQGDVAELFSGRTLEELRTTLTGSLAEATLEKGKSKNGNPVDIIKLSLKSGAILETFIGVDPDDPSIQLMAQAVTGNPVTHRFTLDESGRLLSWDQIVLIELMDLDLSGVPGIPAGTQITLNASQRQSLSFSEPGSETQAVAAPSKAEMARYPAFSGAAASKTAPFKTLDEMDARLNAAVKSGTLDSYWEKITALKQMPLLFGDTVIFFYRGGESPVAWDADWGYSTPANTLHFPGTDLWLHAVSLPSDARLEYQLRLGGDAAITDPLNPLSETGGLGTKSVVEMPGYIFPEFTLPQAGIPQGELTGDLTLSSASLGYDVNYRVYTPSGYENLSRLPVLYITDGQDFLQYGKMATVLDNLIAAGKIDPVIAVFIDPRDVETGENLREQQFFDNPKYTAFITGELLPAVDAAYRTDHSPEARALLGVSNGGYFVASFALSQSHLFHLFAMQSPSIWHNSAILDQYNSIDRLPIQVFLTVGSMRDDFDNARQLRNILQDKGYSMKYIESNEGHSYGNWRGKFEEMLTFFFGKK